MSSILRPSAEEALDAWRRLVLADREQVERIREDVRSDYYAPVAASFSPSRRESIEWPIVEALAQPGDTWIEVGSLEEARGAIPANARALLALGSQHIAPFATRADAHFVIRMVDPPAVPLPFASHELVLGKPSSKAAEEKTLLQRHGIAPVLVQEHVGAGLQDHLAMSYYYKATEPTLNNVLSSLWGKLRVGVQYVTTLGGPLSISVNQCGGFVRSHPDAPQADMQLYCNPITYTLAASKTGTQIVPDRFAGFILCFQPCRPLSRGQVEIAGPDAARAPIITPGYLSHPEDVAQALRGAQLIRRLENTDAMRGLIRAPIAPRLDTMDDAAMVEDFRNRASTCYHPVGSCTMGPDAATSVVDAELKVHGLEHLYVVDASVFPNVTSGNTHAPTTMVAHKGAQAILAAARG